MCIISTGYNQSVTDCGSQRRHVVVTQQKLILIADPHPQIEFDFVEKHIHKSVCGAQRRPLLMYMFLNEVKLNCC